MTHPRNIDLPTIYCMNRNVEQFCNLWLTKEPFAHTYHRPVPVLPSRAMGYQYFRDAILCKGEQC